MGGHELGTTGSGVSGGGVGLVAEVGVHGSGCGGLIRGRILGDLGVSIRTGAVAGV